jgi:hypothetical protein
LSCLVYSSSTSSKSRCFTCAGNMSYSSVGAENFSGRSRCLKDTGKQVSDYSHLSESTFTKYCGGKGSCRGTVKLTLWSSSSWDWRSTNYSACRICSESQSCTNIQNGSAVPWYLESQLNSLWHFMSNSTLTKVLVRG